MTSSHSPSDSHSIPVRTSLKPLAEGSAVSTQDSGYGSLSQSFEFDESQDTGDKCGKRTSPTCSSSPSESFKFKRTRDGYDKDDTSQVKVRCFMVFLHGLYLRCIDRSSLTCSHACVTLRIVKTDTFITMFIPLH